MPFRQFVSGASTVALIAALAGAGPAFGESLQDAIALAYQTNPTLQGQRASQRALDETYVQARSNLRPQVDASASVSYSRTFGGTESESDGGSLGVSVSQSLYTGGRIANGISAAEASVLSGRENLRDVEQSVLQSVIQTYVDVTRDLEILRIRQANVGVLQRQLEEASARFEVGEITRTDVAQAEARLAASQSDLASAQAQLSISRATYASVVGQAPATLEAAPTLPAVPTDFDAALETGLADNPAIRAAVYNLEGAEYAVAQARAAYLPTVGVSASYGTAGSLTSRGGLSSTFGDDQSLETRASISVPLFTGGLNRSNVSRAAEQANAAQQQVEAARREVLRSVSSAFSSLISANASAAASQEQVRAARIAAEGVRQEAQVGLRTTLDVLNQELELRSAEVALASAVRNQYVAQAALLAAMGRLSGPALSPGLEAYDPAANFNRVRLRGAVPWEGLIETLDRIAAPPQGEGEDTPDAPIDAQLKASTPAGGVTTPRARR